MAVVLSILYLSLFPRKLIVFPDHLRIKFLAYRSRILKPDDLLEISTRRVQQVWFRKNLADDVPRWPVTTRSDPITCVCTAVCVT